MTFLVIGFITFIGFALNYYYLNRNKPSPNNSNDKSESDEAPFIMSGRGFKLVIIFIIVVFVVLFITSPFGRFLIEVSHG
jgi:Na+/H+ antiporter NhaD/arsenite permease-like protein